MNTRHSVLALAIALLGGFAAQLGAQTPPSCTFGAGDLPEITLPPGTPHGAQIPINRIVVLMQENRSYDHYIGRLRKPDVEREPRDASNPDPTTGAPIRAFHQKATCEVADLAHSWNASHREWNGGAMDGFTAANVAPEDPTGKRTMGFYKRHEFRYYNKLYKTFATADHYFSSLLSQTFPNRFFLMAGTSFGHIRNDFPPAGNQFSQRTIFDQLNDASIDWKIYSVQFSPALLFFSVRAAPPERLAGIDDYLADAAAGTLPAVSFVDAAILGGVNVESDEHPPANVQVGQAFVASVVDALLASPQWPESALFLTYDEHGGFFDHVPPPPACVPDAIAPMLQAGDEPGAFDRYGIRVPMVAVSPFARRRFVSHRVYDHTSILRFIQTRFDLPALTGRDANADPLLELFDFANPPFTKPPRLPKAKIHQRRFDECAALFP